MKKFNIKVEILKFFIISIFTVLIVFYLSDLKDFLSFLKRDGAYVAVGLILLVIAIYLIYQKISSNITRNVNIE